MDTEETGERIESPGRQTPVATDELQIFLGGVHFTAGEAMDASTRPWRGHDRPASCPNATGEPIEIRDHVELGRLIADWAADPASRPAAISELASQLRGVANVPDGIRTIIFVQDAPDTLTIRLPAVDALETHLTELTDPMREAGCPVPSFYSDQHRPGIGQMLTPVDMYLARLGDVALGKP